MFSDARTHAVSMIERAPVAQTPFPHLFIQGIFPPDFYKTLLTHLPDTDHYALLAETGRVGPGYSRDRFVLLPDENQLDTLPGDSGTFWRELFHALLDEVFANAIVMKFQDVISARAAQMAAEIPNFKLLVNREIFLVRDRRKYSLGPHTDSPSKLISVLFYLPADASHPELGTSFYRPRETGRTCSGGPHYPFEEFERAVTMPYRPNTLVAIPKSNHCFHGVEPVADLGISRDLLFYDLRLAG